MGFIKSVPQLQKEQREAAAAELGIAIMDAIKAGGSVERINAAIDNVMKVMLQQARAGAEGRF